MLETESNNVARSIVATETGEKDGTYSLLEEILHRDNLNAAYLRVKRNGGAAGIDGMTVEERLPYLKEHKDESLASIRGGV